ncbi:MAG: VWA domain-containing protein [Dehalococcoidia bacterium]|nr:VWA domain-containing protein [Dehalococcoidia bacterium]
MGVASPATLMLLIAVLLLGVLMWSTLRWQRSAQQQLAGGSDLALLAGAGSWRRRVIKAGLLLAGLIAMVAGAAGPYAGHGPEPIKPQRTDVLVVLDVSLSMLAQDVQPSRFETARRGIRTLLDSLQSDRVGVAIFGGRAALRVPFTLDYTAVRTAVDAITPDSAPTPGSSLSEALRTGLSALRNSDAPRKGILLITDGEDLGVELDAATAELKAAGIPVNTLGVGTAQGGPIPVRDARTGVVANKLDSRGQTVTTRLGEQTLRDIATQTGGAYLAATSGGRELLRLYDALRAPTLAPVEESAAIPGNSLTPWLALLAFTLLVTDLLVGERSSARARRASGIAAAATVGLLALMPACSDAVDEAFVLNQDGLSAYDRGQYDSALEQFRKAQVRRPDLPLLDFNAGAGLYKKGEDERAIREWQRALQTDEEDLRRGAEFNTGNALFLLQRYEDATEAFKRVLRTSPGDMDAKINLELALQKLQPARQPPPVGTPRAAPRGDDDPGPKGDQQQPPERSSPGREGPNPQDNQLPPRGGPNPTPPNPSGGQGQRPEPPRPSPEELERQAREALRRAIGEAGEEVSIEEALRILEALRAREQQLQGQYNRPPETPGRPSPRPERDW